MIKKFFQAYLKSGWMPIVLFWATIFLPFFCNVAFAKFSITSKNFLLAWLFGGLALNLLSYLGIFIAALYQLRQKLLKRGILNLLFFFVPLCLGLYAYFYYFAYGLFGVPPQNIYKGFFVTSPQTIHQLVGRGTAWQDYSYWICFKSDEAVQLKRQSEFKPLDSSFCEVAQKRVVENLKYGSEHRPWLARLSKNFYPYYLQILRNPSDWECLTRTSESAPHQMQKSETLLKNSKENAYCFRALG